MKIYKNCDNHYKIAIIGGGFSSMICGINLASSIKGDEIIIIERNNRLGKKILSTGNGRCNITNKNLSSNNYHSNDKTFVCYSIERFNNEFLVNYFKKMGILLTFEDDKCYPLSLQASSVLDCLRYKIDFLKINCLLDSFVISITKKENTYYLSLGDGKIISSDYLVISGGGKSASYLGTDGNCYKLVNSLGHNTTNLYPSLVQIKTNLKEIKGLKGIKVNVKLQAIVNGKLARESFGDLLFTDYGLSGNSIFSISSYITDKKNVVLRVDFCPSLKIEELSEFIKYKINNISYLTKEDLLSGIVNKQIGKKILKDIGEMDFQENCLNINVDKLVHRIKNCDFTMIGNMGFENSQVTKGGIDTSKINNKTMESLINDNLFFTGEIIDVDGDCGGYNLQWAFSSAIAASEEIKRKYGNNK